MKFICFHNPDEENGYLSNWFMSDFVVDGINFSSMEKYMMYSKAICFGDKDSVSSILNSDDVAEIKAIGRQVKNYDETIWNGLRQLIVYDGLKAKFSQNEQLKTMLIGTGDAVLAECAVRDVIWGIGLSMTDSNRNDMSKWRGSNLLGFALMQVREQLK